MEEKNPEIRYVHIGLIQICITTLFRQGMDVLVVVLVLDKIFVNPLNAIIGGVQYNLVNGIIWFNIKQNFFISITYLNIEDSVKIKIQTKGIGMKNTSSNLSIH